LLTTGITKIMTNKQKLIKKLEKSIKDWERLAEDFMKIGNEDFVQISHSGAKAFKIILEDVKKIKECDE
jgi:uncharacterized protein YaaW (UPF0174 family)